MPEDVEFSREVGVEREKRKRAEVGIDARCDREEGRCLEEEIGKAQGNLFFG